MDFKRLIKNGKQVSYSPPYPSIFNLLSHHKETFAGKDAVVSVDVDTNERSVVSYTELFDLVIKTANFFLSQGVKTGDRVALLMHNTVEILIAELAAGILGASTVPLDFRRDTLDRKLYKLEQTDAKILLTQKGEDAQELLQLSKRVKIHILPSFNEFKTLHASYPDDPPPVKEDLQSLYLILYTSGTTAHPKGVALTSFAMIANAEGIADWQKLSSVDRFGIILPLHHINSTTMSLATLLSGGTVILSSRYSTSKFWKTIAEEKITITSVVPTIVHDLLVRKDEYFASEYELSPLRRILVGSAPVLPEETQEFYRTFRVRVVQGYGQTETALRVTGVPIDLDEKSYLKALKSNTIGIELMNNNIAICKADGSEAQEKEEGEICIRGPVMADGYWNDEGATKESFRNGWFHSGDIGYWKWAEDKKKYFFIVGRSKEIIIKGGVNLSPALIEDLLLKKYPEIDEVSVVGFQDARVGEEVAAAIVLKKDQQIDHGDFREEIITDGQNGKITNLSSFEAPKKVFFVNSLPKTSTGKIQRVEVKKTLAEEIKKEKAGNLYVRQVNPNEKETIKKATEINNERWHGLAATEAEFTDRARYGALFGVFDELNNLLGTISCIRMTLRKLEQTRTWDEASAHGTLRNNDPNGEVIVCLAISVKSAKDKTHAENEKDDKRLKELAKEKIEAYVQSNQDHVLSFHRKPKGGLPGARVWKILENGRVEDKDAMGYNVIMKYPDVPASPKITSTFPSPSIALIEYVLSYAQRHGMKYVFAFSRPAGLRKYLTSIATDFPFTK